MINKPGLIAQMADADVVDAELVGEDTAASSIAAVELPKEISIEEMEAFLARSHQQLQVNTPVSEVKVEEMANTTEPAPVAEPFQVTIHTQSMFAPSIAVRAGVGSRQAAYNKDLTKRLKEAVTIGKGSRDYVLYQRMIAMACRVVHMMDQGRPIQYKVAGPALPGRMNIVEATAVAIENNRDLLKMLVPYYCPEARKIEGHMDRLQQAQDAQQAGEPEST